MPPCKEHPEGAAARHRGPKGSGCPGPSPELCHQHTEAQRSADLPTVTQNWHRSPQNHASSLPETGPGGPAKARGAWREGCMGETGAWSARRPSEPGQSPGWPLGFTASSHGRSPGPSGGPPSTPSETPDLARTHIPRARFVSRPWGKAVIHFGSIQRPTAAVYFLRNNGFFLVSIPQMKKQIQPL